MSSCPHTDHTFAVQRQAGLLILLLLMTLPFAACSIAAPKPGFAPDVLVLVLGFGTSEQAAIDYDSVVPLPKAQADLDAIAAQGKWNVSDAKGETKASGGPNPKPTTSISFRAKGMIDYANGTLPMEPFIDTLKRFRYIEMDYIAPANFQFHGLEDFENSFVKIDLDHAGNSYRYRITVKDAGFTTLDLPLRQPVQPASPTRPASAGAPLLLALVLALAAAVLVYLAASYVMKKGKEDESRS